MRGIAILAIILHNYCHYFPFTIKENEYSFHGYYSHFLWKNVFSMRSDFILDIFSFFGHYGVPVFLFISGYGLYKKYEKGGHDVVSIKEFAFRHYLKLLTLMFVGFVAFIFIDLGLRGYSRFTFGNIIAQLTMVINLLPHPDDNILPGPYWYFGLTMQLYMIYRLFFYRRSIIVPVLFVVVCWLAQAVIKDTDLLVWMRYNFIGSVMPFVAGMLYAKFFDDKNVGVYTNALVLVVSTVVICLFGSNYQLWLWIPLFVVISTISFVKMLSANIMKPFTWIGGISASIFVIHPLMRPLFLIMSKSGYLYTGLILYILSSVILAWLYNKCHSFVPKIKSLIIVSFVFLRYVQFDIPVVNS